MRLLPGLLPGKRIFLIICIMLTTCMLLFIIVPIIGLFFGTDFTHFANALLDPNVRDAILVSVTTGLFSTLIGLFFGIPTGYLLAKKSFFGKSAVQSFIDLPIIIPHTVAGVALLIVFSAGGVFGTPLSFVGIKFRDTFFGIIVAMLFVSIPFIINSSRVAFENVPSKLEYVARNLGASEGKVFFTISLPLAHKGILTGAIMAWARAVSEFGAVIVIAYWPKIAPTLIYETFTSPIGLEGASPIAVLLLIVCFAVFFTVRFLSENKKRKKY